jgi:ABC-type uncharacterized transport system permease subunit
MNVLGEFVAILDGTLRTAAPLIFAALAGLFSERSGIVDIGIEGKMLAAAFAAAAVAYESNSAILGVLAAVVVSSVLALIHGYASIAQRGNQVVSGLAINFLCAGLTASLGNAWYGQGGQTPRLLGPARFHELAFPWADAADRVPVLGSVYTHLISGQFSLVYLALLGVPLSSWAIKHTRFGLRLRAVGEYPAAVDTAGVSVTALRYHALLIGGVLCGIAGCYLSLAQNAGFSRDMTAGRGYLALAALIFSNWHAGRVLVACLLFGLLEAIQVRFQGVRMLGFAVPTELIEALPYVFTVVMLAGFVGRSEPPRASGIPYVRGS